MPMQHEADPAARAAGAPDNPSLPVEQAEKSAPETGGGAEAPDPAPDIAALLQKVEAEAAELRDAWPRACSDIENMRKQAAADVAKAHKFALERFATELLPVKDALESALATKGTAADALAAGVELTLKQLNAAF